MFDHVDAHVAEVIGRPLFDGHDLDAAAGMGFGFDRTVEISDLDGGAGARPVELFLGLLCQGGQSGDDQSESDCERKLTSHGYLHRFAGARPFSML